MAVSERFEGANVVDAGRLSPYWGEHAARYTFAQPFIENRSVLDIACGTGYGVGMMQRTAAFVAGADVSMEAAVIALTECRERSGILLGNGLGLPFADETFDIVTSFETIEHLHDRALFVKELHRVLKKGGKLLISTPNAKYSKPMNGKPSNPFHVFEYTPDELRDELESHFEIDRFLGQSLDPSIEIPPFYEGQKRLPTDVVTQTKLFGWKAFNKIPVAFRERLSEVIWQKPFYPTEADYVFSETINEKAPTLLAVCVKK